MTHISHLVYKLVEYVILCSDFQVFVKRNLSRCSRFFLCTLKSSNNHDNTNINNNDGYKSCESYTPARKNRTIHMRCSRKVCEGYIPIR